LAWRQIGDDYLVDNKHEHPFHGAVHLRLIALNLVPCVAVYLL